MTVTVVNQQPLIDAIKAAVIAGGVAFGDGAKPANVGNTPYIVAFFDAGAVESQSLKSRDGWSTTVAAHCSGLSPEAARIAVRRLKAAMLDLHGQVIDGRQVRVMSQDGWRPPPMQRDDDADPTLFIQYDEWRFYTSPV